MNSPLADLSHYRADVLEQTHLGQICGSKQRLRDRYEVIKLLGRGGFGVTFLARDMALPGQPRCVIKQLCPKVNNPEALQRARQRFEQEAKTLSRLGSHAQIPCLLDYFELEGEFFLIQEYVRGITLSKEVRQSGPLSEMVVKRFLLEFLPLLQYVHNNGVIHRDIKPPNLLRCLDDGRLVLIDFGAVKERIVAVETSSSRATSTQFVGTVGFAPPEQLSMRPIFSSDLYALGMTCLFMLTGKVPLEFDYEFITGEVKWQDEVNVSDHFARILNKMLKISPQDRYHSAKEVLRALELEPHLDSLLPCMNNQPLAQSNKAPNPEAYVPPLMRSALAIRDWRSRMDARRARYQWNPPLTLSHSQSRP